MAEQALPHAIALAKGLDVKVDLVRVTPAPGDDTEATDYLRQLARRLQHEGVDKVDQHLLHGDPADAIVERVRQMPDSLVAVTTRGHSGIRRWTMGSVTDRVVRYSGAPVLVIRAS